MTGERWQEIQRGSRARHWDAVEGFFADVPPDLFPQGQALRYELALWYSTTGDLRDALTGADRLPLLSIASFVLADLGVPRGRDRDRAERHLTLASVLLLAREHVRDRTADPGSFFRADDAALAQRMSAVAEAELAKVERGSATAARRARSAGSDGPTVVATRAERVPADPRVMLRIPRWSAAAQTLAGAAARYAGHPSLVREMDRIIGDLAAAFQILTDLRTLPADLGRGRMTYPVAVLAGGTGLARVGPDDATRLLAHLVTSRTIDAILAAAVERLARAERRARARGLPTLASFAADAQRTAEARFMPPRRPPRSVSRGRVVDLEPPPIAHAITMAERHLLADTSFRASWETHREGMFSAEEVSSRFPTGLILEILAEHGHVLTREVERFVTLAAKDRFRYYSHPSSATDTDTLGVVLRLGARCATALGRHRAAVERALRCVDRHVSERGSVPVWLGACAGATARAPRQILLGEGCATVQAHFLIGLTEVSLARHRGTVVAGARSLAVRVARVGLAANVNYPPLYALGTLLRLAATLGGRARELGLRGEVEALREHLLRELATRTACVEPGAQDAALAIRAANLAGRRDLIRPRWIEAILKRQAFDGSWPAEPFAVAPNRGRSITPYATVPVTTALCYDALRRAETSRSP